MCLSEIKADPQPLYEMVYAKIKTQLVMTGIRLGVHDHLETPASAGELARRLELEPVNAGFFLNGLAALGLLEKKQGLYRNTRLSSTFLVSGLPTYLGEGFLMQETMQGMMVKDLDAMLKKETKEPAGPDINGPCPETEHLRSEEEWGRFAGTMANSVRAGVAQQMAGQVSALPEFPGFKKMLDLGSGPGIYGIAMVAAHPTMTGVLFDRKPSMDAARTFIREYGMEDRVTVMPGDYNTDAIGAGYDLIWASSTLNFAQPDLGPVMDKIYQALNPGGVFINFSEGLTHESTRPAFFVLCTMAWSMQNRPLKAFDQGVIADAMLNAGFRSVRSRTPETCWGPMDLDIARK